ncbi:MAG TPA: cytochrome c3 family protein [Aridibacter sp.]|nr:cytochrome c3 family protein [Aridibacter sp.]
MGPNAKRNLRTAVRSSVVAVFAAVAASVFLIPGPAGAKGDEPSVAVEPEKQSRYSKFSHDVEAHKKKECSECHRFPSDNWKKVRPEADAFPDISEYPKHDSCISCHRQQFFSGSKPAICSICHVNPSPRDSRRHPFPNPREAFDKSPRGKASFSEFAVAFPHEIHVAMLASRSPGRPAQRPKEAAFVRAGFRKAFQSETCAMCHQLAAPQGESDDEYVTKPPEKLGDTFWLKKGTFMTSPTGHTQCFTCHSADAGLSPAPSDCGTCHKLTPSNLKVDFEQAQAKRMAIEDKLLVASWRRRDSSATFRHEWFSHAEMDCTTCHALGEIRTADWSSNSVKISTCSNCHITATSDDGGILNYEIDQRQKEPKFQCVKCHFGYSGSPIPASHPEAIKALSGN